MSFDANQAARELEIERWQRYSRWNKQEKRYLQIATVSFWVFLIGMMYIWISFTNAQMKTLAYTVESSLSDAHVIIKWMHYGAK